MRQSYNKAFTAILSLAVLMTYQNCSPSFKATSLPATVSSVANSNILTPDISSFSSNVSSVTAGTSIILSFKVLNAKQVILNPGAVDVTALTSLAITPAASTTYTLTAMNDVATITKSVSIVVVAAAPVINSFVSSLANITTGQSATLSWSVSGAVSLSLDPGAMDVSALTSKVVSPTASTIYTLTATNSSGVKSVKTVSVTVNALPPPLPAISSLTATPASIVSGQTSTLNWIVSGATTLMLNPGNIDVSGLTSKVVSPTANTTYTLTASNVTGPVSQTVNITVTQPVPKPTITSFTSSSLSILPGDSITLSWVTTGATSLVLNPGNMIVTGQTSITLAPTGATAYSLTATNASGSIMSTLNVVAIAAWTISPAPTFVVGSGATIDLTSTLPAGIILGGTFQVDLVNGPALPAGMTLSPAGIISVGSAAVSTVNNVIFIYTEP